MKNYYSYNKEIFIQVTELDDIFYERITVDTSQIRVTCSVHTQKKLDDWQVINASTFYRAYNRTKERLDEKVFEDNQPKQKITFSIIPFLKNLFKSRILSSN